MYDEAFVAMGKGEENKHSNPNTEDRKKGGHCVYE